VLDTENRNRQKIEAGILEEALSKVEREVNFARHRVIVLAGENWHPGVIGIVASRLADRFYRPAIMISLDGKLGKGSGRSIERFHLFDYLLRCRDCLSGFGGHEAACGITIEKDRIDDFRQRINEEAARDSDESVFSPKLDIDMDVQLGMLSEKVIEEIECMSPFGTDNPKPVLASRRLKVKDGPRQIGKNGFKMLVGDGRMICEAVSFGRSPLDMPAPGSEVDIAYVPSINDWQGIRSIQLELKDIQ
jgi:single-stranded-DNA-specific exonuclease